MSVEISERSFEEAIECALLQYGPDACASDATAVRETPPAYGDTPPGGYRKRKPEDYDRTLCLLPRDVRPKSNQSFLRALFGNLKVRTALRCSLFCTHRPNSRYRLQTASLNFTADVRAVLKAVTPPAANDPKATVAARRGNLSMKASYTKLFCLIAGARCVNFACISSGARV